MRAPEEWAKWRLGLVLEALSRAKRNGQSARGPCPFCERQRGHDRPQNMAYNLAKQAWFCQRCKRGGYLDGANHQEAAEEPLEAVPPPEGYTPLWTADTVNSLTFRDAIDYARRRKITKTLAYKARLGVTVDGPMAFRLIVPVFLPSSDLWAGYIARDWTGKAENPYRYPAGMHRGRVLYHPEALTADREGPALLVESFMDTVLHWDDATAFMGKPSHEHVRLLLATENARPMAVCLDGDAWREGEALAMRLTFEGKRAGFVRLPPALDPNEIDPSWLREEARRCVGM